MTRRNPKTVHPFFLEVVSRVQHGERAVRTELAVGRRYPSAGHEGPHTNARNPGTRNRRTRRAYRGRPLDRVRGPPKGESEARGVNGSWNPLAGVVLIHLQIRQRSPGLQPVLFRLDLRRYSPVNRVGPGGK